MGIDAMVIRHHASGAPLQVTDWVDASVINAGDGTHEHPTQALLDCYTILEALTSRREGQAPADLSGLRIAIVGDIKHSRVARSNVLAFSALGAEVVLVAPPTLMPASLEGWPVDRHRGLRRRPRRARRRLPAAYPVRATRRGAACPRSTSTTGATGSPGRGRRRSKKTPS